MQDANVAIRDLDEVFMQRVREQKARELAESSYVEDATLLPPNHPSVIGRLKIAEFWQGMFQAGLNKVIINPIDIDISGNAAYAQGQYGFTFQRDGKRSYDKGKYLSTYRKQEDGIWRVVAGMYNSDKELP